MATVYLSLGSNQGVREALIKQAIRVITRRIGTVERTASYIETEPWGYTSTKLYVNTAVMVKTDYSPAEMLRLTQRIEHDLGRIRKSVYGRYEDRLIDIDIIFYMNDDEHVVTDEGEGKTRLVLPHPLMHKRRFVLQPLAEIAPQVEHPILKKTVRQLLAELPEETK